RLGGSAPCGSWRQAGHSRPPRTTSLLQASSIRLTCATSASDTSTTAPSPRFLPGAFFVRMWRFIDCPRLILPLAVILKRFTAARFVFSLSFPFFFGFLMSSLALRGGARRLGFARGLLRLATGLLRRARVPAGGLRRGRGGLGLGRDDFLLRRQDLHHRVALLARRRLDQHGVAELHGQPVQDLAPDLAVDDLAAAEDHERLHLVAVQQEAFHVAPLESEVVLVHLRPELHFLDLDLP